MANVLTVSSSYKAIVDTTSEVANQIYAESALDQIIGARGSLLAGTYDHDKCSVVSGTVAQDNQNSPYWVAPITSESFFVTGWTLSGTEPAASDDINAFYIKCDARRGRSDNRLQVYLGSGTLNSGVLIGTLNVGEGVCLFLNDTLAHINTNCDYYVLGQDEVDCTIALVGA